MIGTFGDAEIFSFHATKVINSFEGGAVVTNHDVLAENVRVMRNFGLADRDHVTRLGINAKMSEVSAAMGLTSLEDLQEFIATNQGNYCAYREELADIPGLRLLEYDGALKCNYHYVVVEVDEGIAHLSRDQLTDVLRAENVLARRYFYPGCHRIEPYRSQLPHAGRQFPVTERLAERVLCLPTGATIGRSEIHEIGHLIRFTVGQGIEVRERLLGAIAEASRLQ
jgi:dTDP-4-amino-4,6-dideoxygalactose transaminase